VHSNDQPDDNDYIAIAGFKEEGFVDPSSGKFQVMNFLFLFIHLKKH